MAKGKDPAFPHAITTEQWDNDPLIGVSKTYKCNHKFNGISQRDFIAAMAMQAILHHAYTPTSNITSTEIAEAAFEQADAMIKAGE